MVLQTDFFRNNFRRTNNLLRYFSIDERKTLWGHKYCYCYRGRDNLPSPWRANAGEGWEGKMKLRFVKFLTSRENEIEKKEEAEQRLPLRAPPSPARLRPELRSAASFSPSFPLSLPLPSPPACSSTAPVSPPPRVGRAMFSSCPCPSCSASPFLLHKLPEQKSVADVVSS